MFRNLIFYIIILVTLHYIVWGAYGSRPSARQSMVYCADFRYSWIDKLTPIGLLSSMLGHFWCWWFYVGNRDAFRNQPLPVNRDNLVILKRKCSENTVTLLTAVRNMRKCDFSFTVLFLTAHLRNDSQSEVFLLSLCV